MESGGQPGNTNAVRGRVWREAINRAIAKRSRRDMVEAMDALAERLLVACDQGDVSALKELGDRLEGKAAQPIVGEEGAAPLVVRISETDAKL